MLIVQMGLTVSSCNLLDENTLKEIARAYDSIFHSSNESSQKERLRHIRDSLLLHSSRNGYKCALAYMNREHLVGFAYGYYGEHGQWWYDHVEQVLDETQRKMWLNGYFELVEIAVKKEYRRRGIATMLYSELFTGLENKRALLSTQMGNGPAICFYSKMGWNPMAEHVKFSESGEEFVIMGRIIG